MELNIPVNELALRAFQRIEENGIGDMISGSQEDAYERANRIVAEVADREVMRSNDEGQEYVHSEEAGSDEGQEREHNGEADRGRAVMSADQYQEVFDSIRDIHRRETNYLREQADRIYYAGSHPSARRRADRENIQNEFENTQRQGNHRRSAAQAVTPRARARTREAGFAYESNRLLTSDGTEKQYKIAKQKVDWGSDFSEGDFEGNINLLTRYITDSIEAQFGGWTRIHEIYVRNDQLIINGIQYLPILNGSFEGRFPLDCYELLKNGCTAPLFDWSKLRNMKALAVFDVDDVNFYVTSVADGLGLSRRIGVGSMFRICPNLRVLVIGGRELLRGEENTEKGVRMKRELAREKHFVNLFDGVALTICSGTDKLAGWTFNNLKTYACNRGNKGLIKYCGGVLSRSAVALSAGAVSMGAHTLKAIGNGVSAGIEKFKDAVRNS